MQNISIMSNTSNTADLIEQVKYVIYIVDTSVTGPHMEFMATYDNFLTIKEDGEVFALSFDDAPAWIDAWRAYMGF